MRARRHHARHRPERLYTYDVSGRDGGVPVDFDVFDSVYRVTVREARTGTKVAEFTVPGAKSDQDSCPYRIDGYIRALALGIDEAALQRNLRPLAEANR